MSVTGNSVRRKFLMALTGQMMILFVLAHLLGNCTIFFNSLNEYAGRLHTLMPVLWVFRVVMLTVLLAHVYFAVQLTLENWRAKPVGYAVKASLRATFASKSMIWTGVIILAYLIYHVLQFAFQVINPEMAATANMDAAGNPDVNGMVVRALSKVTISSVYMLSMAAVFFHLTHGIQSSFQSLGLNNERLEPSITRTGLATSIIIFAGYVSIPVAVILGILKG